jgi:hypothetical protein
MGALRTSVILLALCAQAAAQTPEDPYASEAVLNEQIAESLVLRAQELLDAKIFLDAKQLAVEALVKSPKGNAAERAKFIIKTVNLTLHIKEDPPPTPPSATPPAVVTKPGDDVDLTPIDSSKAFDPSKDPPPTAPAQPEMHDGRTAGMVHAALYGGVLGATIGSLAVDETPAKAAVPIGIGLGVGFGLLSRPLVRKLGWDEGQIRTTGSINFWSGVAGGMFGWAVTGEGEDKTPTADGILLGASIGATAGLFVGAALAKNKKLTRGDVALVDTLGGIGAVGGLTIGMLMQPAQKEAYAVNSLLGAAGGVVIGIVAAPQTNTTPRRMLRVAGLAAAGGALPFLLYAGIYNSSSVADERVTGFLSSLGMVAGAYFGFRFTRGMDEGLDTHDGTKKSVPEDVPVALLARGSSGRWGFGGVGVAPLSRQLATTQSGATLTVLGASW